MMKEETRHGNLQEEINNADIQLQQEEECIEHYSTNTNHSLVL